MPPFGGSFFFVDQFAVSFAELLVGVVCAVVAVEDSHLFPELRRPFVGADVDKRAVQVKNIVFVFHVFHSFSFLL